MGDTMHALVDVMCDAVKTGVHDVDTVMKMGHVVEAGLRACAQSTPPPRSSAIGDAAELAIQAPIDSGKFLPHQKHIRRCSEVKLPSADLIGMKSVVIRARVC